jgi:hypothetical protein
MDKADSDKVKKFDEITEFAREYFPDIIAKGGDDADGLVNALLTNYPKRPNKRNSIDDALEFAMREGRIIEDSFDYSVFNQDQPTSSELFDLFQKQVFDSAANLEEEGTINDDNFSLYVDRWRKKQNPNDTLEKPLPQNILDNLRQIIEDAGDEVIEEGSFTKFATNDSLLDQFQTEAIKDYIREKGFEAASKAYKDSGVEFIELELGKKQTSLDAINNAWNAAAAKAKPKTQTESLQDALDSVKEATQQSIGIDDLMGDASSKPAINIDDLVENEVFSVEQMQDMLRNKPVAPSSGKGDGKGSDVDNMKFSAIESLSSQLLSRMFGTSFYPVLTALRTARQLAKVESGGDVGLADIVNFSANSSSKALTEGMKSAGLGKFSGLAHSILGIQPAESSLSPRKESGGIAKVFEKAASSLDKVSDNLGEASSSLDSLAENGMFGGGGGKGGGKGPGGFNVPENGGFNEDGKDGEMSPAEKIAALLGLGAYGGIMLKLIGDAIPKISGMVSDQFKFASDFATNSISNPGAASAVALAGQPIKAAGSLANTAAPFAGAMLGRAAISKFAGTALGTQIGGAIGTAAFPVIGTIIGAAVGSMIGDTIGKGVGSIIETLKSIDEGIQQLSIELTPFNAELNQASVEANLRTLQGRMDQADYLGSVLAENVTARSEFELAVMDLGSEITIAITPILTDIYTIMRPLVQYAAQSLKTANYSIGLLKSISDFFGGDPFTNVIDLLDAISRNTQKDNQMLQDLEDFINPAINQQALDPSLLGNTGAFGGFPIGVRKYGVIF